MTTCFFLLRVQQALQMGVHSSRKEFAPTGANSFLEEVTLVRTEAKKGKTVELPYLKVYPSILIC